MPPCTDANHSSGDLLHFGQRTTETREVGIGERRQQRHQNDVRDTLDVALGRRGQARKRLGLPCPADAGSALRYGDDASPRRRNRHPRNERTTLVAIRASSAFDDETAILERPGADRGTLASADGARQRARIALHAIELGERAGHSERELRPRAEPDMRRQRCGRGRSATAKVVVGEEQAGELAGALGVFPIAHERIGGRSRHEERRPRRGGANAAEPSPARASQIEDAEVQARRSLDEDRLLVPCVHAVVTWSRLCMGRGEVVANDLAALHDELHALQLGDVGQRIAGDRDEIGELAFGDRAD